MARPVQFTFSAADDDAICVAQQIGAAGDFTINGAALDKASFQLGVRRAKADAGTQRVVTLTSTGNISGVNFTITGLDVRGRAQTETLAGPNNNTVATTDEFAVVTQVETDGAVGTDTEVGFGTVANTNWWKPNHYGSNVEVGVEINVNGTISVDLQRTFDDVQDTDVTPTATDVASWAAITADTQGVVSVPSVAYRFQMNSGTGSAVCTLVQQG